MPFFGVNEMVRVQLEGRTISGKLVDANIRNRQFKVETEEGYFWITQNQIIEKIDK